MSILPVAMVNAFPSCSSFVDEPAIHRSTFFGCPPLMDMFRTFNAVGVVGVHNEDTTVIAENVDQLHWLNPKF